MMSKLRKREAIEGYLFVTPLLVGLVFFTVGPVLASLKERVDNPA
jgi:ABC-type sugar transport system permease subunit